MADCKVDTGSYYRRVASLSKKQIDSLISLQFDKDSNHVAFNKLLASELKRYKITPTEIFPESKFSYWNKLIEIRSSGSYEMHNDENVAYPQIYSLAAKYDIFGNLVGLTKEGMQDSTSASLNSIKSEAELKESLRIKQLCYSGLTEYVKAHMNDPKSFELVNVDGSIVDNSYVLVTEKFRGKNAYNATITSTIKAKCTFEGDVIKIVQ